MVKFETKLNAESTKSINKNSFKRMLWILLVISLMLILFGLVGCFMAEDNADRSTGIGLIVFGVLFTPLVWGVTLLLQKNINKSARYITDETDETYIFDDETLYIKQVSKRMQSESTYNYDYLYKVMESATHYFLYISKLQCHVVPKNTLVEGDLNVLNELLRLKLGNKFRCK